jgi:hypothetical protein
MKITLRELRQLIRESILENMGQQKLTPEEEKILKAAGLTLDSDLPAAFKVELANGGGEMVPKVWQQLDMINTPDARTKFFNKLASQERGSLQESVRKMVREEVKRQLRSKR